MIHNPILPGFHPDPSVVRLGEDYFLATSTFVWQPGIRLFHSRDLADWELVGHGLDAGMHDLRGLDSNGGVWAPDLSHDPVSGRFHLAYSVVHSTTAGLFDVDNYVVTTTDVRHGWSRPRYLNSVGFDPSLFHDDDGRSWLVTLEWDPREGYQHPGAIVLDEYDRREEKLVGPTQVIHRGSTDRGCLEGPRLFKRNGWYYLMTAEGGTGYGHGVALARSREIAGPYESGPVNPFLTSNPTPHFGRDRRDHLQPDRFNPHAELQKAGHGSLVDTPSGECYVVHLCARPVGPERRCVLGRETAVQQVSWTDDGWLRLTGGGTVARAVVPGPGEGRQRGARPAVPMPVPTTFHDGFEGERLDRRFSTFRRAAADDWLSVGGDRPGLRLRGGESLTSRFDVSLVATQRQHLQVVARTRVTVRPRHLSHSAGLVVFYDEENFAYARVYRSDSLGSAAVGVVLVRAGVKQELLLDRVAVNHPDVGFEVRLEAETLRFWWSQDGSAQQPLGPVLDATFMSDEATDGFMGTMIGLACVDAYRRDLVAEFACFDLHPG